ncbi:MAG: SpoIIE family protein phosphatase, partial [Leptospiraceae bacterium]|nr:SpoIIE family protein phosphatase [Leptospiraceae bacterium]
NSLSREGVIGRDAFQTTFSLTIVLGMFAIIIIFLNNTRDRTTFLAKLIGISLVTILLVMQALSFFVLGERTRAYDELRVQEARAVRNHEAGDTTVAPLFLRQSDGTVQFFAAGQEFRESALPDYPSAGKENLPRQSKSDLQHGRFQKATRDGKSLNYISYRIQDANADYEVAFPYLSYRTYVHDGASTLAILLIMVMVVLVAGFPLFFRGALINPLMELLGAVKRVDEGDLQANVRVRVEDEIGQLGHYFNGMVVSIRDAQSKLKEYADRLEEKVQERTAELQKTLTRVQELKNQQDGDYFLTSLLLRPLQANRAKSETVNVDFFIRQKKSFTFRKWEDEIGGDLCMAESIKLRGRPFTLFLNADAMGKSMQGAGGALVLGAVLEAIVDRTMLSGDASSHHPERWLKNAFIELHKVFETFDGSMLISMVFGLVDDNTGLVYMINAEHPWSVLYKGEKADFVETDLDFRKLGTLGVEGSIFVKTLQLEPGDVLIAGSDGRDDVRVQRDNGDLFIQDDENEFLQHVEAGKGVLNAIVESIESRGQLTDDLSLLRIGYREDLKHGTDSAGRDFRQLSEQARAAFKAGEFQKAINMLEDADIADSREAPLVRLLAQCYLRIKDYSRAVTVAEDYCFLRPADTEMLYAVSYAAGRSGQLDKAADYGERIRLREPHNTRYLLNLARIYAGKGNLDRAQGFLDRVLESEPDNDKALKLAEQLKGAAP